MVLSLLNALTLKYHKCCGNPPAISLFSLQLCNFATVLNHNIMVCQRDCGPQAENHCSTGTEQTGGTQTWKWNLVDWLTQHRLGSSSMSACTGKTPSPEAIESVKLNVSIVPIWYWSLKDSHGVTGLQPTLESQGSQVQISVEGGNSTGNHRAVTLTSKKQMQRSRSVFPVDVFMYGWLLGDTAHC